MIKCCKCDSQATAMVKRARALWPICVPCKEKYELEPVEQNAHGGYDDPRSTFDKLNSTNVSRHVEKKGRFSYLSWCYSVGELLKVCPDATWEVHTFPSNGGQIPYMLSEGGAFVQVSVNVEGVIRTQIHPVLDHKNNTVQKPNAFQVTTSIQRCLAKAIALHGLGLYIYKGEDLPEQERR